MSRILTFSLLLLSAAVLFLFSLSLFDEKDIAAYQKLEKSSTRAYQKERSAVSYCEQKRKGVSKCFWIQKEDPLTIAITAAHSSLFFFAETKMVEEMEGVFCTVQEELFYRLPDGREVKKNPLGQLVFKNGVPLTETISITPMQRFRTLAAQTASHNYQTNVFVANDVLLKKYETVGHGPPDPTHLTPLMHGTADEVELFIKGEELAVRAKRFTTTFNPQVGGL